MGVKKTIGEHCEVHTETISSLETTTSVCIWVHNICWKRTENDCANPANWKGCVSATKSKLSAQCEFNCICQYVNETVPLSKLCVLTGMGGRGNENYRCVRLIPQSKPKLLDTTLSRVIHYWYLRNMYPEKILTWSSWNTSIVKI